MKIFTISNLFPRPDSPRRGIFNLERFKALASLPGCELENVCLVAEWRIWRWSRIRRWQSPEDVARYMHTSYKPVFYIPIAGRSIAHLTYQLSLAGLAEIMSRYDVILSTWLYADGAVVQSLAEKAGKPHWMMVQGSDSFHLQHRARRNAILDACSKAAGVFCVWRGLGRRLADAGVDEAKIHVMLDGGVDQILFKRRDKSATRRSLNVPSGSRLVLYVGNLVPIKGPDRLLGAWAKLMESYDGKPEQESLRLVILGEGRMRKRIERLAAALPLDGTVSFMGNRPHAETAMWMSAADCLCLTSRSEGLPNVILEAIATGLPIVATDAGGCPDLLEGEQLARVVKTQTAISEEDIQRSIAGNIGELLESREKLGVTRYNRPVRSWPDMAVDMIRIMQEHIAAQNAR